MTYKLEPFQENGINLVSQSLQHHMSSLAVSPTGSGKTVIMATIAYRFITKQPTKCVVIAVHREELLEQTREKLFSWYGIVSQKISATTKTINKASVYVCMVETLSNRLKNPKFEAHFSNCGLLMIDECHLSNFKKIFIPLVHARRIGFTATPIAATKNDPLNNYYQDCVVVANIKDLIEFNEVIRDRGVIPCIEYSLQKGVRDRLKTKAGGDFDEDQMGEEFSKPKQIQNTIDAYIKYAIGKKTVVFNSNIKHSKDMNQAFLDAGFNSRHLDGNATEVYRRDCFKWLAETPDAILNNVGIATTGFDDPTIQVICVNKSVTSLPLWKQMVGRGGRPYKYSDGIYKEDFLLLDMGDNIEAGGMGRYDDDIDWKYIFQNPKLPRPGISGTKTCPECGAINYVSAKVCTGKVIDWFMDNQEECGYLWPQKDAREDEIARKMVRIGDGIDVKKNIEYFEDRGEYFSMRETCRQVADNYKRELGGSYMDSSTIKELVDIGHRKCSEWHKIKGKRRFPNLDSYVQKNIVTRLEELGYLIPVEELLELSPEENEA